MKRQASRVRSILPVLLAIALLGAAISASGARAATLEPIGDFEQPIFVSSDPGDPNRLLVAERLGKVQLVEGETTTTLLDLTSLVGCPTSGCSSERGLMSIAPSPDFDGDGRVFVFYAQNATGVLHVDEFTVVGDSSSLASRRPVIGIPHSQDDNHNGGQLQFGPEDNLFISTGDGGGSGDQYHQAQDLTTLLGKVLRIDPDEGPGGEPYTVPAGNPFISGPGADEIWSYGLRNPFRFSFDSLNGGMVIGDVGQGAREEVDYAPAAAGVAGGAGANYGWNCREGLIAGPGTDLPGDGCQTTPFVDPVFDYPQSPGDGSPRRCSIIGGYVSRDVSVSELLGRYVYADLCIGQIRSLVLPSAVPGSATGDRSEGLSVSSPRSFGEDACGRLYVVGGDGSVSRFAGATPATCFGEPEEPPEEPEEPEEPPVEKPPPGGGGTGGGGQNGGEGLQPLATIPPAPIVSSIRLRAEGDARSGERVMITAQVLPCAGREGQRVRLNRGGRKAGSARLDDRCKASFHPRVTGRATFRARVSELGRYLPARSERLTVEAS